MKTRIQVTFADGVSSKYAYALVERYNGIVESTVSDFPGCRDIAFLAMESSDTQIWKKAFEVDPKVSEILLIPPRST